MATKWAPHTSLQKFTLLRTAITQVRAHSWDGNDKLGRRVPDFPHSSYRSVELFAGAGGLALGLEMAGFDPVLLNEIEKDACATLSHNRPNWPVIRRKPDHSPSANMPEYKHSLMIGTFVEAPLASTNKLAMLSLSTLLMRVV